MICKQCGVELGYVPGIGWIHPPIDMKIKPCTQTDALEIAVVDDFLRDIWDESYPKDEEPSWFNVPKWKKWIMRW